MFLSFRGSCLGEKVFMMIARSIGALFRDKQIIMPNFLGRYVKYEAQNKKMGNWANPDHPEHINP